MTRHSWRQLGLVLWAWWRSRGRLLAPAPLIGLSLACLATRLVFEISLLNYYFLAVGVALLMLDFTRRRLPVWSVVWIVATRYGLTPIAPHAPLVLTAILFLVAALVPIVLGLAQVPARDAAIPCGIEPPGSVDRSSPPLAHQGGGEKRTRYGGQRQGFQGLALRARPFSIASRP